MLDRAHIENLNREELIELVLRLAQQNATLSEEVALLRREIDELKRRGKRQAAPFSKAEPKPDPKPPGRKPGQGRFTRRLAPAPESYSQPPIEVAVTEESCPECGGRLLADGTEIVTRTEVPARPKPEVTAYAVQMCRCSACGKRIRGTHPDVAADQFGATAHRLGPRLLAEAQWLHYGLGIPVRKLPRMFKELHGIELTQSAVTQHALRQSSAAINTAYEQLRSQIATRDHVHSDDTGWSIAGVSAWLMGFSSDKETLYQIRSHHGNEQVREVIGADYRGVLHTDRFKSYDAKELSEVPQQKCMAHIQRNLSELINDQRGSAKVLPQRLKTLFSEAIELWHQRQEVKNFRERADDIQQEVDWLLWPRRLSNDANDRMVNELGWHNDRGNLLRFLHEPERAEPTNNEAERVLRPAVIARKVSQCSKNDRGASAHAKFTSVIATAVKRGATSVVETLRHIFTTGEMPASLAE